MQASAHSVRPRRIDAIRRAIPSESEHNLHLLARGRAEVAVVYRGQTRPWWDRAEKEMVYEAIAGKSFEDYVKLIAASA